MFKKDKSSNGQELLIAHIKELGADIMAVEGMIKPEWSFQRTVWEKTLFHASSQTYFAVPSFAISCMFVVHGVEKAFKWKKQN